MDNKKKPDSAKNGNGHKQDVKIDPKKVIISKPIYIKENKQYPSK